MTGSEPLISADSHISEVEACFADIESRYQETRPKAIYDEQVGAVLAIPNLGIKVPMGVICTAGRRYEDFGKPVGWAELHPAGHDPKARLAVQDEEGVQAELLYPSLGMVLCNHPDQDYKTACFAAYNRWLAGFCEVAPERLVGVGMVGLRTVEEGIAELHQIKAMGFRGAMLPGNPAVEDYDHDCYAPFWEACIELGLPPSFHILTTKDGIMERVRGSRLVQQIVTVRGVQNIVLMMVLGGVFDRHPDLQVVCVESDAGWVPHFKFRMDHAYERHRFHLQTKKLERKPSEYFDRNIYVTFQDDHSVRQVREGLDLSHVLWATDFPHGDGTYPRSRQILADVTRGFSDADRRRISHDNAAALYHL